ncbi:hypothetical protein SRS16CHR_00513 [Variovorax sp. SRS16]|uniref:DUF3108 domain-containing protein n=1 Tax=Variovorax sp. SRS16 TaxID=282217 RepID=UPI0013177D0B|nr:DUF3108 domain-containing protein [Variovorax sp. SRS16]VTU13285.1 hypothetical protein SRS16CHR_00513 [Variovorax sp. SRS16]
MPTLAAPALPAAPRPPRRGIAALTVAVVLVHLVLLGLTPAAVGPRPSPLANKFITRTIVIGPPAAAAPAPAATAGAEARPSPPRPARPRPAARPRAPAPAPAPSPAPQPSPRPDSVATPDIPLEQLIAQANAAVAAEQAASAAEPAASAAATPAVAAASGPAAVSGAKGASGSASASAATASGDASGNVAGPVALRIPGSVKLAFAVTGQQGTSPMQGVFGELTWLQDGQQYDARLSLTFLFRTIRTQHSAGMIGPTGIEPARFSETRKTEVASHFVRDQGTIVFSSNTPSVPLMAGAQDRLSIVMQLGALLAGDPAHYPQGAVIAIQTVGPRDADIWTFNVEGEEKLSLPAGDYTVRKLTRNPRKPFDDKVELWVAPELGYLPVRIKQTQANGDFADLQLREILPLRQ